MHIASLRRTDHLERSDYELGGTVAEARWICAGHLRDKGYRDGECLGSGSLCPVLMGDAVIQLPDEIIGSLEDSGVKYIPYVSLIHFEALPFLE